MSQVSNAVKLSQSVKAVIKTIKRESINCQQSKFISQEQSQSRTKSVKNKSKHTRQCSLSSRHNSVRREVEVLFLVQRERVRI
jgi:hypothetical protein